jgi:hypothetical protein
MNIIKGGDELLKILESLLVLEDMGDSTLLYLVHMV